MKKINITIGIICIIFSILVFIGANSFDKPIFASTTVGASFYPKLVASGMFIISSLIIISSIMNKTLTSKAKDIFNSEMKKPLLGMVLIIIYSLCVVYVGYLISTLVFCFMFLHILGVKKKKVSITITIIFSSLIYFVFSNLFLINLPRGFLI